MICLICGTMVKKRDDFYWEEISDGESHELGAVHDDCLIRVHEFNGEHEQASKIHAESNTLPKG